MATVQDTIGAAIAVVLKTFSAVTITAAAYGKEWPAVAAHVEGGRALVEPLGADPIETYADSAKVEFEFAVQIEVLARTSPHATQAGLLSELRSKFSPEATTLQDAVASLSLEPQPLRATIEAHVDQPDIEPSLKSGQAPGLVSMTVPIRAHAFVTV